ncbi:MAG: hypothetical protein F4Y49_15160 [Dehalococcoidia bacterium]|nr:hypothetical protein [Dehalococcoidia bacterium]MYK61962.1 hypothetical protein [Chloroflexota bacterium]
MVTTSLPFDEWTEVFGGERLTGALLDRLAYHVHSVEMNGESYRLKQSKQATAMPSSNGLPTLTPDCSEPAFTPANTNSRW